ncbi:hypothetical protein MKX08_005361 [Trichoderma sp. CBMAI-0020]|nr:hypothetical protein MKX08_005361 [Trichoderma sp. CBMAI-0020]
MFYNRGISQVLGDPLAKNRMRAMPVADKARPKQSRAALDRLQRVDSASASSDEADALLEPLKRG